MDIKEFLEQNIIKTSKLPIERQRFTYYDLIKLNELYFTENIDKSSYKPILKHFLNWFGSDGDRYKNWRLGKPYGKSNNEIISDFLSSLD